MPICLFGRLVLLCPVARSFLAPCFDLFSAHMFLRVQSGLHICLNNSSESACCRCCICSLLLLHSLFFCHALSSFLATLLLTYLRRPLRFALPFVECFTSLPRSTLALNCPAQTFPYIFKIYFVACPLVSALMLSYEVKPSHAGNLGTALLRKPTCFPLANLRGCGKELRKKGLPSLRVAPDPHYSHYKIQEGYPPMVLAAKGTSSVGSSSCR